MSLEIELHLRYLECIKSNEEDDEVYCMAESRYVAGSNKLSARYPSAGTWDLKAGQSVGPGVPLYNGPVETGIEISVKFMEEDAGGLISVTDDTLGGFSLEVRSDRSVSWNPHKNSEIHGHLNDGSKCFLLKGSKAEYKVGVKLYEKVPFGN